MEDSAPPSPVAPDVAAADPISADPIAEVQDKDKELGEEDKDKEPGEEDKDREAEDEEKDKEAEDEDEDSEQEGDEGVAAAGKEGLKERKATDDDAAVDIGTPSSSAHEEGKNP